MRLYTSSFDCKKRMFDFDGFKEDFSGNYFSVVVYWNEASEEGVVNLFKGAHFIFVRRTGNSVPNVLQIYNRPSLGYCDSEDNLFGYGKKHPKERIIASYVFANI